MGDHDSFRSYYKCFDEALFRVKQTSTLRDYQHEFKRLANMVVEWPQSALIGTFIEGLRDEIADEVHMAKPIVLKPGPARDPADPGPGPIRV
jgi:hypothetical protein